MPSDRTATLAAAIAAIESGRFDLAVQMCGPLTTLNPGDTEGQLLLGLAEGAAGRAETAARALHRAARDRGTAAHPIRDLLAILRRTGQENRIDQQIQATIGESAADPGLLHDIADDLYDSGRAEDAIPLLTEALRLAPDNLPARNLLAMAQAAVGRTEEAIAALRHTVRQDPYQPRAWANLGLLLKDDGSFHEAIAAYDTAVSLAPDDAQIRVNRVVALLRAGRWAEAWTDYEWRLTLAGHATRRPRLLPMLSTLPDLAGRIVLAVHEDGFGDTLHFARFLPMLAARGARVLAAVPPALGRLMRTIPDIGAVHNSEEPWPDHDYYCPFFSLPRAFETAPDAIPAPIPYLRAEPMLEEIWRQRLPAAKMRVGLVWAGQARPALPGFGILDGRRSMTLAALAPLADVPGVVFISLQHGIEANQARTPPAGMTLFDPMADVTNFADTAAIVANLDLVISVDTAIVHLAGAMGKPVFMLDRYDHCWRWAGGPWYPAMRIFRQARIGDWTPMLCAAVEALKTFASGHDIGSDFLKIPETV